MDVCIHGAGPVGACLALALSRHGLSVGLVDPRRSPAPAREDLRAWRAARGADAGAAGG